MSAQGYRDDAGEWLQEAAPARPVEERFHAGSTSGFTAVALRHCPQLSLRGTSITDGGYRYSLLASGDCRGQRMRPKVWPARRWYMIPPAMCATSSTTMPKREDEVGVAEDERAIDIGGVDQRPDRHDAAADEQQDAADGSHHGPDHKQVVDPLEAAGLRGRHRQLDLGAGRGVPTTRVRWRG